MSTDFATPECETKLRRVALLLMLPAAFMVGASAALLLDMFRFNALGKMDFIIAMLPLIAGSVLALAGNIRMMLLSERR